MRALVVSCVLFLLCVGKEKADWQYRNINLNGELLAFEDYRFNAEASPKRVVWMNINNYISACTKLKCTRQIYSHNLIRGVVPLNVPGVKPGSTRALLLITENGSVIVDLYVSKMTVENPTYNLTSFRNIQFQDEPAVIVTPTDTGNLAFSIVGLTNDGMVIYRHSEQSRTWVLMHLPGIPSPIGPISFIDLNGDCAADLAYLDQNGDIRIIWNNKLGSRFSSNFMYSKSLDLTLKNSVSARSITFADLRGSGLQDIILSSGTDIWVLKANTQKRAELKCKAAAVTWTEPIRLDYNDGLYGRQGKVQIRVGDYNLDGMMDMLFLSYQKTVMVATWDAWSKKFVVEDATPQAWSLGKATGIETVTFYDLDGNGRLKIIANVHNKDVGFSTAREERTNGWLTYALEDKANPWDDAFFIKPQVVWGYNLYGTAIPGATSALNYRDLEGNLKVVKQTQLFQTSHGALQMPFCVYGLGRVVNYLEWMHVGLPNSRSRSFQNIMPNSNVILLAIHHTKVSTWVLELYVDISVALTTLFIAILCVCVFLLAVSCILQRWEFVERHRMLYAANTERAEITFLTF